MTTTLAAPVRLDVAALFAQHRDQVYHFLLGLCGHHHLADELTQETFERVLRWAGKHVWQDRGCPPSAILFTTARRLAVNAAKARARRKTTDAAALAGLPATETTEVLAVDRVQRSQWRRVLFAAVARLGPLDREAVLLYYVDGWKLSHIAIALQLTQASVRARLHRARARLREDPAVLALRGQLGDG